MSAVQHMSRRDAAALACGVVGILSAASAPAAEWLVSPDAIVSTTYVDNPRLLRGGGTASAGAIGDISASVQRRTERAQFLLQPRLRAARYRDDESFDSDERHLAAQLDYRTERSESSGSLNFTRDTTLTSELGSTGFVQINRPHESWQASTSSTLHLGERTSAGARLSVMDNHYPNAGRIGLVDYQYRSASLFAGIAASELSELTFTAQGSELVVPNNDTPTRDASLRFGWKYQPDSIWTMDLSAGPAYVDAALGDDRGVVFDLDLQRQAQRWRAKATLGRNLVPTGRGVLTRRDSIALSADRNITEYLSGGIYAQVSRNQDLLQQAGILFEEIEYGRVDVNMNWQMTPHWSLSAAVGGAKQSSVSGHNSAYTYRASLSIVWNGQSHSL